MRTSTLMPTPVADMATSRAFACLNAFSSHAWTVKAIEARTAYGARRLGEAST